MSGKQKLLKIFLRLSLTSRCTVFRNKNLFKYLEGHMAGVASLSTLEVLGLK